MLRARMFRSLIPVLMIKERNIRARNITIYVMRNDICYGVARAPRWRLAEGSAARKKF